VEYAEKAKRYTKDVMSGEISACEWVKLACKRFLRDLEREANNEFDFVFNTEKANRVCNFIQNLPHIKGEWANRGETITLQPWQCFLLCNVFGWVHCKTGFRRFRTAYCEVPRKNAKSTLSSGVGLYMLTADNEQGAEVYSAATTRDQAKIVFEDAKAMARKAKGFSQHYGINVNVRNINRLATSSKFEPLSADAHTLDGLNIHCAIVDELHAHPTRKVYDVLETGTGSRAQSLLFLITTAGSDRAGICYEQREYVTKILQGIVEDDTYWGIIYTIDEGTQKRESGRKKRYGKRQTRISV